MGDGDDDARAQLFSLVYQELHDLAERCMRGERIEHTLQPTALVHEAYLRLTGTNEARWEGRAHFFGAAIVVMRRILVDHARSKCALRRGGGAERVALDDHLAFEPDRPEEVVAVDRALVELETIDGELAEIVMLRFFGGLQLDQIAAILDVSVPTIKRRWRAARAWPRRTGRGRRRSPRG